MRLLSLMLVGGMSISSVVFAEPDVEGKYQAKGGSIYLLPEQNFVVVGYATALTGKYNIQGDTVHFHWSSSQYPRYVVQEFTDMSEDYNADLHKPTADQILVQFDSELQNVYIGLNQQSHAPKLKKVWNADANCFEYSNMNVILPREKHNSILLYQAKQDDAAEFSQRYQIPDSVNHVEIRLNKNRLAGRMLKAKIMSQGLVFYDANDDSNQGDISQATALSEMDSEEQFFINQLLVDSQHQHFFDSEAVVLKNIQLDDQPILKMQCHSQE